ncbi:MAG: hypothetical protein KC636_21845 [Myxococcales bacterium]|nr:hypothetical protein [Myxococcales bacterium]
MKKFRTLLALAVLAPMLAGCAPAPEDVCQHVVDLMKKQLGDQADAMPEEEITKIKDNCVKEAEKEKEMKGSIEYNKQAKCVMAAETLDDLSKCEEEEKKE